jgi:Lon-like ATP-dependent protease
MTSFFIKYGYILYLIQLFFAIIIGMYFWNLLKGQQTRKTVVVKEAEKETRKLKLMRNIKLTEPLSSLTRPAIMDDVVGQPEGIDLLRSALCNYNPQHVIIYGPPGVGKTAAARLVLEEAKKNSLSPFDKEAKFVEVDATITRFDERNIADPLIGSVHDPIYQGAGSMGSAGIPQPKPGACTKAHGGILFID